MVAGAYDDQLGPMVAPARAIFLLTKADDTDLPQGTTRGICCGTAGTCNFMDASGNTITNFPLQAGYNPIRMKQLHESGTADDIWGLY